MADRELKINVSAPGAKQAAEDIKSVAGSQGQAVQAADASTAKVAGGAKANKDAATAAADHKEANSTLKESLSKLGPEFSILGDALGSLTLKQGGAAVAWGLIGAAALGAMKLISMYNDSVATSEEKARKAAEHLRKQADAYRDVARGLEEVLIQEGRMGGGRIETMPAERAVSRLAKASDELLPGVAAALGKEKLSKGAATVALMGPEASDEEIRLFAVWMAVTGSQIEDPYERLYAFNAFQKSPTLQQQTRVLFDKLAGDLPSVMRQHGIEERQVIRGATPEAQQEDILSSIAQDRNEDPNEFRKRIEKLIRISNLGPGKVREELRSLVTEHPDLANIRVEPPLPGPPSSATYGDLIRAQSGRGGIRQSGGVSLGEAIHYNAPVYHGGTHYHGQHSDPAGERVVNPAG